MSDCNVVRWQQCGMFAGLRPCACVLACAQVVAAVQQESHQQRRGPAVETLRDDQLFFVDKARLRVHCWQ
jgi:hypothetical protein